jgi:hypothetical protein
MSKTKCYSELQEVKELFHYREWRSRDSCGKEISKKLKEIKSLLEKQEVHKY